MRSQVVNFKKVGDELFTNGKREEKERRSQVTLMYMLGIEYIICSMASRCVSAISALHPSIAALGFASGCYLGVQV